MENWVLTLTILPSVGLLLLSTTSLSIALSNEIDHLIEHHEARKYIIQKKLHQLKVLSWALIALYLSASTLALDGLIGAFFRHTSSSVAGTLWTFIFIFSIFCLCIATALLITFAIRAVSIKQKQFG